MNIEKMKPIERIQYMENLLDYVIEARKELDSIEFSTQNIEELEKRIEIKKTELLAQAEKISEETIKKIEKIVLKTKGEI